MSVQVISAGNLIANITAGVFITEDAARALIATEDLQVSPAEILAAYLIDEISKMSRPTDNDTWPLYISHLPDGDNVEKNCGAIYDTAGVKDGRIMQGAVITHPGLQVRIRSVKYRAGYKKISELAVALDSVNRYSLTVGSGDIFLIHNASRTTDIVSLGVEPGTKRRFGFTVNYIVTLSRLT